MSNNKNEFAAAYYDSFSRFYDLLSPKWYYHRARKSAIKQLSLTKDMTVLNVPVGTGQNFEYFQKYLNQTGLILGADVSSGMLSKAKDKTEHNQWRNVQLVKCDVAKIRNALRKDKPELLFDAVLCDLGLSGFDNWEEIIDMLLSLLKPGARISVMDWYLPDSWIRGPIIKWIGKGEVDRPIWQYLSTKVDNFVVDATFNRGGVFVASGNRPTSVSRR
jgi:ubiquinone/menaquinone biosynthesis C-methylase UbiE